jgi:arabinosaccharide transport system substrate-binding protein
LVSKFMSDSNDVPDAVEVEINSIGKYFRPPANEVGFLPLNEFLEKSGWMDKIVKTRFAPWSKGDVIFGVPHDVHPVAIVYRDDLFREVGIDLSRAKTWVEFRQLCLDFQSAWRQRGHQRRAIEMNPSSSDHISVMLLQRRLNPIDNDGKVHMTEGKFAETVAFYAECIGGPTKISGQFPAAAGGMAKDLSEGHVCAVITPDWRLDHIKQYCPDLAGKVRMMPLPVFEAGDPRTATWGGTMIGIPRRAKDPQAAWKLIEFLYFSHEGLEARRQYSSILPPVITLWDDPVYQRPDPYFGGQRIDQLYIALAKEIPARYVTPATPMAFAGVGRVIVDAKNYVEDHPGDRAGLLQLCRRLLADSARDLQRRIEHGKFEE